MKCHLTVPAMLSNGEVKRPERACPETLYDLRSDGVGSCPYHGLVEIPVVDDLTGKQQEIMDRIVAEAKANGKKKGKKKGRKSRG
jgi:hypothetical protein